MLPKMSGYTSFNETKYISFLIEYDELRIKSAQIFMMMKYQKKVLIAFVYKINKRLSSSVFKRM